MAIGIEITERVSAILKEAEGKVRDGTLENVMGRALVVKMQEHFFNLNATRPNQLGGARTNFYAAAARSTNSQARPGQILISVNQVGIRQRLQGGEIRAVKGKYLTIPATAEAHGRRAGEFSNLRFGFAENRYGNLQPALVKTSSSQVKFGRKRKDGTRSVTQTGSQGGEAVYFLTPRVFQRADPTVIPTERYLADAAMQAAAAFMNRIFKKFNK